MSSVQILEVSDKTYPNVGRYYIAEMQSGKHRATVCVHNGVRVIVHNASNRCWRGMGRHFADSAAALSHYRTPEVRAMIETAIAKSVTEHTP